MVESEPAHSADYEFAQRVTARDGDARDRFTKQYGEKILQTVYIWCKPFCDRNCRLRRAGIRNLLRNFLHQECDQILEGYTYLLGQIEDVVLRRYKGHAALETFLYSILNPKGEHFNHYRIEFVRSEKGKLVLPVWTKNLKAADLKIFKEFMTGRDVEDVAVRLALPLEEAEAAATRIRQAAMRAGWGKYWNHYIKLHAREVPMPASPGDEDDENAAQVDIPDPANPPDVEVERKEDVARAMAQLSPLERVVIRLLYLEGETIADVMVALDKPEPEIRKIERQALKRLRSFFSAANVPSPEPKPPRELRAGVGGGGTGH